MSSEPRILVVDLGSQISEVIARVGREMGYRMALLDPDKSRAWLQEYTVDAVILSGGDNSVNSPNAIAPPKEALLARTKEGKAIPILGICYGHHYLAKHFGGTVANEPQLREYGEKHIELLYENEMLFRNTPPEHVMHTSHGDTVVRAPEGWRVIARSIETGAIAAMRSLNGPHFSVQYHPEAPESPYGKQVLKNFLDFCGCKQDWQPSDMIATMERELREAVRGDVVVAAYSGGVDSSVAARVATLALGPQVKGLTIDADHLQLGELNEIRFHANCVGLELEVADMRHTVQYYANTVDAQEKRKIFQQRSYLPPVIDKISRTGAKFALQGTLAPDMIESGKRGGVLIKTHHNTGIDLGVEQLQPLAHLFKHEVRELARLLKLPESIAGRKPSPGPCNILRVVGTPVTRELLESVRWAYAETAALIKKIDPELWEKVSQLVVAYLGGSLLTGVRGDARAYEGIAAVRAVNTVDFMTARGVYLPEAVARPIISTLSSRPPFIRVMIDATDKAPATIEYE